MKNHGVWKFACLMVVCLGVCSASASAQEKADVKMDIPRNPVWDLLDLYQRLSHRPVYLSLATQFRLQKTGPKVSLSTPQYVTPSEALALLRKALLDSCGVEIRDNGTGEILVSDPLPTKDKPSTIPLRPQPN